MVFSVLEECQSWGQRDGKLWSTAASRKGKHEDGGASVVGEDRWSRVSREDGDPKILLVSPSFLLWF